MCKKRSYTLSVSYNRKTSTANEGADVFSTIFALK